MSSYYDKMAQCAKISIRSREIEKILAPRGISSLFRKVDCAATLNEIEDLRSQVSALKSDFESATSAAPDINVLIASVGAYLDGLYASFIRLSMICKSLDKKQRGENNIYQEDFRMYAAHLSVFNKRAEETAELFNKHSNELRLTGVIRKR